MRTRRSLTTAAVLALTLTASTLSAAAHRDTNTGRTTRPDRPSIVMKIKRVLTGIVRAFEGPTLPVPESRS